MGILGVDPGLADTGWAFLEPDGPSARLVEAGLIRTPSSDALPRRLMTLHHELSAVLRRLKPEGLALEQLFFTPMARTQFATTQARGVILLAAAQSGAAVSEYNPREVKQALTGNGNADKMQMQKMVQRILALKELPRPDDVADAMAIGVCHLRFRRLSRMTVRS